MVGRLPSGASVDQVASRAEVISSRLQTAYPDTNLNRRFVLAHFNTSDGPKTPRVTIVTKSLADRLWPQEDPIGKTMRDESAQLQVIVGVVPDTVYTTTLERERPPTQIALPCGDGSSRLSLLGTAQKALESAMRAFPIHRKRAMMMYTAISRGTLVGLVLLSIACGRSPTAPTASVQGARVPSPPAPPPTSFPAVSGLSRTFTFDRQLAYALSDYTKQSRFVLYDNGAFALQYASLGGEYRGVYAESNGVITFQFEGWSTGGAWDATGTLKNGSLSVQYNLIMQMSDFEDAVYVLKQ